MQIVMNIGLVVLVSLAASLLLLAKLHRQLSNMIEGRIYRERAQNWPRGVHAKYQASSKELMLHAAFFILLGITVGLLVYAGQQLVLALIVGALALAVFYLLAKEVMKNLPIEVERNRAVFEGQKRR